MAAFSMDYLLHLSCFIKKKISKVVHLFLINGFFYVYASEGTNFEPNNYSSLKLYSRTLKRYKRFNVKCTQINY